MIAACHNKRATRYSMESIIIAASLSAPLVASPFAANVMKADLWVEVFSNSKNEPTTGISPMRDVPSAV